MKSMLFLIVSIFWLITGLVYNEAEFIELRKHLVSLNKFLSLNLVSDPGFDKMYLIKTTQKWFIWPTPLNHLS